MCNAPPSVVRPPRLRRWAAALALACALSLAGAAELAPGEPMPAWSLQDQNERAWSVQPQTRLLLFAADKAASDLVVAALGAEGGPALAAAQAQYLADVHAMPALVTRLFALPALRALPYPVGLVRDEAAASLPRRRGEVTLLELAEDGRVRAVAHAADVAALRRRLGLDAR
ncbi:hypothetical protein [Rubrivivax gelatinosus]|uniref:FAD/FMN-containing dehydrogenase n=1 Tax=Rubrivivax gelatinosus TaxID=28068 RepID=A0A4R2M057_RUBGE|nr:hypothetical protein [Rubrivivax gelatinosus]MBK1687986.1 hypothetical protein [Rubrivivax gelatinosus]TCO99269.1 hypothetical protein EV684_11562 [Rubrivivax gelatinosus]